jgi:hypothetical protein
MHGKSILVGFRLNAALKRVNPVCHAYSSNPRLQPGVAEVEAFDNDMSEVAPPLRVARDASVSASMAGLIEHTATAPSRSRVAKVLRAHEGAQSTVEAVVVTGPDGGGTEPLWRGRLPVQNGKAALHVRVPRAPVSVEIDPRFLRIDRERANNRRQLTMTPALTSHR